ncbi:alpha-mannosidase [Microlunatus sagamiharensis]|uniref:Alpha-mannosidase n=1 Tax=Microlunatus sagamiharensis TaxID=546874 RepID=A0A1H2N1Z3_9ACTN|nr:glycoside hydrolase family 38 C-terminal domain-containing protein [Microlunatus sagamiharensis]SDU99181.1 alpha-mannosidase [Microlunatus sagamiharensis]
MPDLTDPVEERLARFRHERVVPALYRERVPLEVTAWQAPGEPVPFDEAARQEFMPFEVGTAYGPPWATTWFRATGTVPEGWDSREGTAVEVVVDLGFSDTEPGFQAEGLVWTADGTVIKAVEPMNQAVPLPASSPARQGSAVEVLVEAASNPHVLEHMQFNPTHLGNLETAGRDPLYRLRRLELALRDVAVWELDQDLFALSGLLLELPANTQRRAEVREALDRVVDAVDPQDVAGTAQAGRDVLRPVLERPASASAHQAYAVGHAHIDSAWLWPVRETVRKVARTFANVCDLIEREEQFVFAASSAQQYAWLKEFYPGLFERVRGHVQAGRFVPVGGMWVESDTNMPGGEALARQFVLGKGFFARELGVDTQEVWLPDSFGYSGALPQIMAAAGARWFLTQKISWNDSNLMPHSTFRWEGIDGTQVFTHFPPVDTYNSDLSAKDLARAERNFTEKAVANRSLVPFGHGDGGGGPTREMVAAARRTASLEGSPAVRLTGPVQFFTDAQAELPEAPVWSGELYLEFHRGTYTSQARTKRGNRRSEHLLREAELWATTAAVRHGTNYPYEDLRRAWETVCLQQFHDILPGTSISWVYADAEAGYARVAETAERVVRDSLRALLGEGGGFVAANAGPYAVDGVPALGVAIGAPERRGVTPHADGDGAGFVLENDLVRVRVSADGLLTSVVDLRAGRELVPEGREAGLLQLFRDVPNRWDAWDIDRTYQRTVTDLVEATSVEVVGDAVRVERRFGESSLVQTISLPADAARVDLGFTVDWHERQKLLKLAFPLDVHADRATSEIQFGHLHRPTHANTSWDTARFETVAHRWVHVGEPGYGVAVSNDSTYGHDITRVGAGVRGSTTNVRLSLLRAPLFPDPEADQGEHTMNVSLAVGAGIPQAVAEGYRRNLPLRAVEGVGEGSVEPLLVVDDPAVVVEAVKLAEDGSGDVVVRLYEAYGTRVRTRLTAGFDVTGIIETDLIERTVDASALRSVESRVAELELRPFQLVTLRVAR